jgi:hypothetical protein
MKSMGPIAIFFGVIALVFLFMTTQTNRALYQDSKEESRYWALKMDCEQDLSMGAAGRHNPLCSDEQVRKRDEEYLASRDGTQKAVQKEEMLSNRIISMIPGVEAHKQVDPTDKTVSFMSIRNILLFVGLAFVVVLIAPKLLKKLKSKKEIK